MYLARRYTKALDQIKTIRKEQTSEIKVDKEKLAALKIDRDRATKVSASGLVLLFKALTSRPLGQLRKAVQDLEAQIEIRSAENDKLEEEIAQLVTQNKTFFNAATKYQDIIGKAETLRERRKLVEDNLTQVRATLTELQGPCATARDSARHVTRRIDHPLQTLTPSSTTRLRTIRWTCSRPRPNAKASSRSSRMRSIS